VERSEDDWREWSGDAPGKGLVDGLGHVWGCPTRILSSRLQSPKLTNWIAMPPVTQVAASMTQAAASPTKTALPYALPQELVERAQGGASADMARNVTAIYARSALASGFVRRVLPDGTVTVQQSTLPDFAELDRCLQELSDLGVDPVPTGY
jgi:hypothetical protein